MIIVLGWCDGFGNDSFVVGVFDSVEEARKKCEREYNDRRTRYQNIVLNTVQDIDYDLGVLLFEEKEKKEKTKKKKKNKKRA